MAQVHHWQRYLLSMRKEFDKFVGLTPSKGFCWSGQVDFFEEAHPGGGGDGAADARRASATIHHLSGAVAAVVQPRHHE